MPVENAQTGEPMVVTAAVAKAAIVCRVEDTVYVATRQSLTLQEAQDLRAQLDEVLR